MRRTEFLAVGCVDAATAAAAGDALVRQGWTVHEVRNEVLAEAGFGADVLECRHGDSAVPLVLIPGRAGLRLTGVRRGCTELSWIELLVGTRHQLLRVHHDDVLRTALACAAVPVLAL